MHKSLISLLPTCLLHINKVTSPRLRICAQSPQGPRSADLLKAAAACCLVAAQEWFVVTVQCRPINHILVAAGILLYQHV